MSSSSSGGGGGGGGGGSETSCVYVKDKDHGWLPGHVVEFLTEQQQAKVKVSVLLPGGDGGANNKETRLENLSHYEKGTLPLQNVDPSGNLMEMADMVDLPSLHEAAILYNIKARHEKKEPYTRVGDICIAVNPFQWLQHLYSDETRSLYKEKLIWRNQNSSSSSSSSSPSGSSSKSGSSSSSLLPPHVYESASLAYRGLAVEGRHQSILVSGESGAGKTETVKIVMAHLASVGSTSVLNNMGDNDDDDAAAVLSKENTVVQRVLDSNPLLEAFGNAKTVRNDNSSRFGKYIQLQFDVEDATAAAYSGKSVPSCILAGSHCETYLLEKSRVVSHHDPERTFHIFYELLAAPVDVKTDVWKEGLVDRTGADYSYVGETTTTVIEGRSDEQRFKQRTMNALEIIGVTGDLFRTLLRAVCVVMQLGNLVFDVDPNDGEQCIIASTDELHKLAQLLYMDQQQQQQQQQDGGGGDNSDNSDDSHDVAAAIQKALTTRTVVAGKEVYSVPLKVDAARDSRDAFAKEIYQQSFGWLVRAINDATSAEANYGDARDVEEYGLIGLLDIFGFESFETNRFEQLCINYANEKLQQKYTLDIFQSVQEEYEYEGIELGDISFADNVQVLSLMEGRMGIISVLNEECVRPKGNDASFVSKLKTVNKDMDCLIHKPLHQPTEFAIHHYAGPVTYDATDFVQKNTDVLPNDLVECASKSTNDIIRIEIKAAAERKAAASSGTVGGGRAGAGGAGGGIMRSKKKSSGLSSVSTKFRSQLAHLMHNIGKTRTRYIRCIKPNPEKVPLEMNLLSSAEQLRCAGVVAAVSVSRVAFPNRLTHETAIDRFRCLSSSTSIAITAAATGMDQDEKKQDDSNKPSSSPLPSNNEEDKEDLTGMRRIVETLLKELLKSKEVQKEDGTLVEGFACGKSRVYFRAGALEYLESERLVALGRLATQLQRIIRGFVARSQFLTLLDVSIAAQAMARRTVDRKRFLHAKATSTALACWVRGIYAKRELIRRRGERACIKLQTRFRTIHAMAMLSQCRQAAITMQRIARGSSQRPKFRELLKEAREEAKVNSKLAALQKRLADAEMKWIQADRQRIEAEKRAAGLESGGGGGGEAAAAAPASSTAVTTTTTTGEEEKKSDDAQQKALIDESGEMLELLRKEVFNLRSKNYLLRADLTEQKEANQRLVDHTASLEASLEAVKQLTTQNSTTRMKDLVTIANQKKEIVSMKKSIKSKEFFHGKLVARLQEDAKKKETAYEAEIQKLRSEMGRLRKALATTTTTSGTTTAAAAATAAPRQGSAGPPFSPTPSFNDRISPKTRKPLTTLQRAHFQRGSTHDLPRLGSRGDLLSSRASSPDMEGQQQSSWRGGKTRSGRNIMRKAGSFSNSPPSLPDGDGRWGHDMYYAREGAASRGGGGSGGGGGGRYRRDSNASTTGSQNKEPPTSSLQARTTSAPSSSSSSSRKSGVGGSGGADRAGGTAKTSSLQAAAVAGTSTTTTKTPQSQPQQPRQKSSLLAAASARKAANKDGDGSPQAQAQAAAVPPSGSSSLATRASSFSSRNKKQ